MKNRIFNIFLILSMSFIMLAFLACEAEPIFYNISQEKPLREGKVPGNVTSIVEQGEYIYTQNGNILRKKANGSSDWETVNKPEGNIIRLASTDINLYALNDSFEIYVAEPVKGFSWTKVSGTSKVKTIFDNDASLKNKAEDPVKRIAYYSSYDDKEKTSKLFKLEGTKATEITDYTVASTKEAATYPVKASWISTGDLTVFSDDMSFTSDRKNYFYKTDSKTVKYSTDGKNWETKASDISDTTNLAYYNDGTNSWLYAGINKIKENNDDKKNTESLQVLELGSDNIPTGKINTPKKTNEFFKNMEIIGIFPYPYNSGDLYIATISDKSSSDSILMGSKNNRLWGYASADDSWDRE